MAIQARERCGAAALMGRGCSQAPALCWAEAETHPSWMRRERWDGMCTSVHVCARLCTYHRPKQIQTRVDEKREAAEERLNDGNDKEKYVFIFLQNTNMVRQYFITDVCFASMDLE